MYTIKNAAEQVGVSEATLRAWERRYGIGANRRTAAGYRVYDVESVRTLQRMNALIGEGWSVRAAADEVSRTDTRSGLDVPPLPDEATTLSDVAASMDQTALTALLDQRFAVSSPESVADGWLLPALGELGDAWSTGEVSVAGEHFVAAAVHRRLAAAYDAAGDRGSGPRVLVGLPPGARHELGLLSFAVAARRAGISTTWLGADVPLADWGAAVASADGVVLAAPMESDIAALAKVVTTVHAARPGLLVGVGGSAQDLAPAPCLRLGHRVGPAARTLSDRLMRTPH